METKQVSEFSKNLLDSIIKAAEAYNGGYYSDGVFYTNDYNHALEVAYNTKNSIVEELNKKRSYKYQIIQNID